MKTSKRRQWHRFSVFIVNFEHISHLYSSVSIVDFEHVIAGCPNLVINPIHIVHLNHSDGTMVFNYIESM